MEVYWTILGYGVLMFAGVFLKMVALPWLKTKLENHDASLESNWFQLLNLAANQAVQAVEQKFSDSSGDEKYLAAVDLLEKQAKKWGVKTLTAEELKAKIEAAVYTFNKQGLFTNKQGTSLNKLVGFLNHEKTDANKLVSDLKKVSPKFSEAFDSAIKAETTITTEKAQ